MFPWLIAIFCLAAFVWLWFKVSCKELVAQKNAVEAEKQQFRLVQKQLAQLKGSSHQSIAEERLKNEEALYLEVQKKYEQTRRKPLNRIPAFLFGFNSCFENKNN
ncbi:MAG: hypothetical protein PHE51_07965 [Eubacteriales bacterium]|nr:hypothetical protein [Eubacteriales bacterium]